ncbi:MAG: alpha/beta hydrolase [Clostridia bacterium]|nr:alpha/beta hydrolase [Clostridia bacterium]
MKVYSVDLYDYFKVDKPQGARANLCCYVKENTPEVCEDRKNPAMLVIPGGGYGMVSDREGEPIAVNFYSRGFSSFVLTYSVAPVRFPYQLVEAVMAMAYMRKNAKELSIDENMISAIGFSAGGHLCAMLGSISDAEEVKEVFKSPVFTRPNAIILGYPVITCGGKGHFGSFDNLCGNDEDLKKKLDVNNLVNKNSSPAFIWATYNDEIVPIQNSLIVASAYEREGVNFSIHVWGKGPHGLSTASKDVFGKANSYTNLGFASTSVSSWLDLAEEWLAEIGITIQE